MRGEWLMATKLTSLFWCHAMPKCFARWGFCPRRLAKWGCLMDNRAVSLITRPAVLIVTQPGSRFSRNHQEDNQAFLKRRNAECGCIIQLHCRRQICSFLAFNVLQESKVRGISANAQTRNSPMRPLSSLAVSAYLFCPFILSSLIWGENSARIEEKGKMDLILCQFLFALGYKQRNTFF